MDIYLRSIAGGFRRAALSEREQRNVLVDKLKDLLFP